MRFYFTNLEGDEIYEHQGNIRGARKIARKIAKERKQNVYINNVINEEIVDYVTYDEEEELI